MSFRVVKSKWEMELVRERGWSGGGEFIGRGSFGWVSRLSFYWLLAALVRVG